MDALISAQAGTALLIQGSNLASIHVGSPDRSIPRRAEDAHLLFGDAQDVQVLLDVDRDHVVCRLTREADVAEALQLSLILLDSELPGEIRGEAAEELDALLTENKSCVGLERVLFAHPLPQEADLSGALTLSEKVPRAHNLLGRLEDLQPLIAEVHRAWIVVPDSLFESPADRRRFQAKLVREGLFRELVLVLREGTSIEAFLFTAPRNPALRMIIQEYRPVMQALMAPFRRHALHTRRQDPASKEVDNAAPRAAAPWEPRRG